jgi:hypothetical protein
MDAKKSGHTRTLPQTISNATVSPWTVVKFTPGRLDEPGGFDDPRGRFKRGDEVPVPEWLLKAKDGLRGTDRKAWPRVVKMHQLIEMDLAKTPAEAARMVCEGWERVGISLNPSADIDRCRKLYSRLKKLETGSA